MTQDSAKWKRIEERYRQRRQAGKLGWTEDYSGTAQQLASFLSRNGIPPAGKFLELGCGAGNRTLIAAEMGFDSYGVDISSEAIPWASARAREADVRVKFTVGDIIRLDPYPPDLFDVVFDGGVLYMLVAKSERAECLSSIFRVLKPGGLLYAEAHLVNEQFGQRHEMAPGSYYDPEGRFSTIEGVPAYYFSTEDEFRREIQQAGFVLLRLEKARQPDAQHPFKAGSMYADARKPAARSVRG